MTKKNNSKNDHAQISHRLGIDTTSCSHSTMWLSSISYDSSSLASNKLPNDVKQTYERKTFPIRDFNATLPSYVAAFVIRIPFLFLVRWQQFVHVHSSICSLLRKKS